MPPVKALSEISRKWDERASVSQGEYEAGVRNPTGNWEQNTAAASKAYDLGVQAAIQRGSFAKGVANAGNSKWQENTLKKGPRRWTEGISLSKNQFERGFAPYRTVLENLTLTPRGPKGDPKNIKRVEEVANALHAEKLRQQS